MLQVDHNKSVTLIVALTLVGSWLASIGCSRSESPQTRIRESAAPSNSSRGNAAASDSDEIPEFAEADLIDLTHKSPQDFNFAYTDPVQDGESPFLIAGQNQTELIRSLSSLNGRSIEELEAQMRPGASGEEGSIAGFLGGYESLLTVLANDNDFVIDELKTDHQSLARPLLLIGYFAEANAYGDDPVGIRLGELRLQVQCVSYKGFQYSPFFDQTRANSDVTVRNLDTGFELKYSLLVPHMIERYGFYEGEGTQYRVSPKDIGQLLGIRASDED